MGNHANCEEKALLEARVEACLVLLAELANSERSAVKSGDSVLIMELDSRIEQTVGEKERHLGALRQHRLEHKC